MRTIALSMYGHHIQRVLAIFPPEQLLLLKTDDLSKDPEQVVQKVCTFLGIPAPQEVTKTVGYVNEYKHGKIDPVDEAYLRGIFREDLLLLQNLTGFDVSEWL
jgi:hypothetical protein